SCSGQPVSASPGFWIRGTVTWRWSPRCPATAVAPSSARSTNSPTVIAISVLGVLVGYYVVHRLGVGGGEEPAPKFGVLEHAADPRQGLEVRARRRFGRDQHEEQVRRLAVHRVEVD